MALRSFQTVMGFARQLDELLALHGKVRESLSVIDQRLRAVEDRLTRMEAEQTQVITEARSAATAAGTMVAGGVISDAVTRLTRVEQRLESLAPAPKRRSRRERPGNDDAG